MKAAASAAGAGLVERGRGVAGLELGQPGLRLGLAGGGAGGGDGGGRPVLEGLRHQRQVQQPLAGVVDDVEMHRPRPGHAGEEPLGVHLERQAQGGDRARALGPVRLGRGQRGEVVLVGEARHGVVGLGLEIGGEDPPLGGGAQLGHAAAVDEVRDQRGDEDGLARPREPGDAQADHPVEQRLVDAGQRVLDLAAEAVGQSAENHRVLPAGAGHDLMAFPKTRNGPLASRRPRARAVSDRPSQPCNSVNSR